MRVVGIDPGLTGALAFLCEDGSVDEIRDMPLVAGQLDLRVLVDWLTEDEYRVCVELQAPRAGLGSATSMGKLMFNYGLILGALSARNVSHEQVRPQTWKKDMGIPAKTDKRGDVLFAERLFPLAPLRGPKGGPLDGRADALLIATWMHRRIAHG